MWMLAREHSARRRRRELATIFSVPVAFVFSLMPAVKRRLRQVHPKLLDGRRQIANLSNRGKIVGRNSVSQR